MGVKVAGVKGSEVADAAMAEEDAAAEGSAMRTASAAHRIQGCNPSRSQNHNHSMCQNLPFPEPEKFRIGLRRRPPEEGFGAPRPPASGHFGGNPGGARRNWLAKRPPEAQRKRRLRDSGGCPPESWLGSWPSGWHPEDLRWFRKDVSRPEGIAVRGRHLQVFFPPPFRRQPELRFPLSPVA